MKVQTLKEQYEVYEKKYSLPNFDELNSYFDIDKTNRDGYLFLRQVRKTMVEKVLDYLRLVEMLVNPSIAPQTFMPFIKQITSSERAMLHKIYQSFVTIDLDSLAADIEYSEPEEANIIISIYSTWKELKDDLISMIALMKRNFVSNPSRRERSYFG